MTHRVTSVLLILALAAAAELAPFAPARVRQRRSPRQRLPVEAAERGDDALVHLYGDVPGTTTLAVDRHRYRSVAQLDSAVARPGVHVGATPALVEVWKARIVPDLPDRSIPGAADARPNQPPRGALAARAPPV